MHAAKASFKRWLALKLSMPPARIIPCVTAHGLDLCMHTYDAVLVAEVLVHVVGLLTAVAAERLLALMLLLAAFHMTTQHREPP